MHLPEAATRFQTAMSFCDDVVKIHRQAGSGGRGRRKAETTLNRAVIVMAIAGWQVAIENLAQTGIDEAQNQRGSAIITSYRNLVQSAIDRFSTPNSQLSRQLLQSVGYDPQQDWMGAQVPGRPMVLGPNQPSLSQPEVLDAWIRIRHAIAHGDPSLPAEPVLQHVRDRVSEQKLQPTTPGLRLVDAKSCILFVRRLAQTTGDGFARQMGMKPENWC